MFYVMNVGAFFLQNIGVQERYHTKLQKTHEWHCEHTQTKKIVWDKTKHVLDFALWIYVHKAAFPSPVRMKWA